MSRLRTALAGYSPSSPYSSPTDRWRTTSCPTEQKTTAQHRESSDNQYIDTDSHQTPPRWNVRWGWDRCVEARTNSVTISQSVRIPSNCNRNRRVTPTITIPGVQKPHWLPFPTAILCCTGCGSRVFPMPSTVMTCFPSTLTSGARHAFTEAWYIFLVVGL